MKCHPDRPDSLPCLPPVIPWTAPTPGSRMRGRCRTIRIHTATALVARDCSSSKEFGTCADIPLVHTTAGTFARCRDERCCLRNQETHASATTGAGVVRTPRVAVSRARIAHHPIWVSGGPCLLQL